MKNIILIALLLAISTGICAQDKKVTRIASITVDSLQLNSYRKLLQEQMETAIKAEPGVISYTVYADKTNASKLTIVEVYASNDAYLAHRETPHFKKYKLATKDMVKSLELSEVTPILSVKKNQKK